MCQHVSGGNMEIETIKRIAPTSRLKDFGPLNIEDWDAFLEYSVEFFNEKYHKPFVHKETLADFHQIKVIGTGTYGSVILIRHKSNGRYFAMKEIEKEKIVKTRQLEHSKNEKRILQSINCPMTVYLMYFFKDNSFIYMVMPYIPGGELYDYLRHVKRFYESQAKFYVSQIVLALEYLHFLNLVYRDLKPENIVIDHTGYLKLTDFGFCKQMTKPRTYTICGTPEYIAPEVILNKGYSKAVDWWALGVLMYEFVAGVSPFYSPEPMEMYENVIYHNYKMPEFFSNDLQDLVMNMLQNDASKRFGNMKDGVKDIKDHKWFRLINWMTVLNRKMSVEYRPKFEIPEDESLEDLKWMPPKVAKEDVYAKKFANF